MKKILIGGLLYLGLFSLAGAVFASPINLPQGIKGQEGLFLSGNNFGISAGYLYDHVAERKLTKDAGKVNFDTMGGKIILSLMNKIDLYTVLGGVQSPEYKTSVSGSDYQFNLEDKFIWELGASAVIHEWKDKGIQLFADGNYRESSDIAPDSVTVNGAPAILTVPVSAKWQEWQVALGVSKKFQ